MRARAQPSGNGITQLTGDVIAGPGSGSQVAHLSNTTVFPGLYTNADLVVDSKGRITSASNGSGVVESAVSTAFNISAGPLGNPTILTAQWNRVTSSTPINAYVKFQSIVSGVQLWVANRTGNIINVMPPNGCFVEDKQSVIVGARTTISIMSDTSTTMFVSGVS